MVSLLERRMKDLGISHKIKKTLLHHSSRGTVRKISQTEGSNGREGKNSKSNSISWTKSSPIAAIFTRDVS